MSFFPFWVEQENSNLFEKKVLTAIPDLIRLLEQRPARTIYHQRTTPLKYSASFSVGPTLLTDKNKLEINLDVQHFTPEELSVKTSDGFLIVEGEHDERPDQHGLISRHFKRRYRLPEGSDIEAVESRVSSDGVLVLTVPMKRAAANERVVPILHAGGPVRVQHEQSAEADDAEPAEPETVEDGK